MNAVLLRKGRSQQLSLDFGLGADSKAMETIWRDAEEGERRSRARFAQNAIKPEEVITGVAALARSARQSGSGPPFRRTSDEPPRCGARARKNGGMRAHISALPAAVAERLAARGLEGTVRIAFEEPPPSGAEMVARSHPLPATLAEILLEGALDPGSSPVPSLGRAGAWPTPAVKIVTTVALLRLRYKLTVRGRSERLLLAEEAAALAWDASQTKTVLTAEAARTLLEHPASADLAQVARQRLIAKAIEQMPAMLDGPIAAYARERARRSPRITLGSVRPPRAAPGSRSSRCCRPTSSVFTCLFRRALTMARTRTDRTSAARLRCHHCRRRADLIGDAGPHCPASGRRADRCGLRRSERASRCATRSRATSVSARRCSKN